MNNTTWPWRDLEWYIRPIARMILDTRGQSVYIVIADCDGALHPRERDDLTTASRMQPVLYLNAYSAYSQTPQQVPLKKTEACESNKSPASRAASDRDSRRRLTHSISRLYRHLRQSPATFTNISTHTFFWRRRDASLNGVTICVERNGSKDNTAPTAI